jgi:hypothetical protein
MSALGQLAEIDPRFGDRQPVDHFLGGRSPHFNQR